MIEELLGELTGGLGWGIGGAAAAAVLILGGNRAKPIAKSAIKGYLSATQRVREAAAGATGSLQDLYEEAKSERGLVAAATVGAGDHPTATASRSAVGPS